MHIILVHPLRNTAREQRHPGLCFQFRECLAVATAGEASKILERALYAGLM
jgi:hypothetical protein